MEWTRYLNDRLSQYFNVLVRLLLFDNIKQSLKVGGRVFQRNIDSPKFAKISLTENCVNSLMQ